MSAGAVSSAGPVSYNICRAYEVLYHPRRRRSRHRRARATDARHAARARQGGRERRTRPRAWPPICGPVWVGMCGRPLEANAVEGTLALVRESNDTEPHAVPPGTLAPRVSGGRENRLQEGKGARATRRTP